MGDGDGLRDPEAMTALQVGEESAQRAQRLEDLRARDKNSENCQTVPLNGVVLAYISF